MSLCIVANWKLNGSREFNQQWALEFLKHFNGNDFSSVGIAPASIYIDHLKEILNDYGIKIGAQNIDFLETGARTGEISASMIKDLGCEFSIIGHSERRILFDETNQIICKKLIQANKNSVIPILCIGESAEENKANNTFNVLEKQIIEALQGIGELSSLIIAYEPVWAIGSGKTPTLEDISDISTYLTEELISLGQKVEDITILYGGSVDASNAKEIYQLKSVSGLLVGGASLDEKKFLNIIG